jgi:hypothetical protein
MPEGGCRRGVQPAVTAQPHAGMFCPIGNACLHRWSMDDLLTWCPTGSLIIADHWGRCACGCWAVLLRRWDCGASVQESPCSVLPPGIYPVHVEFRGMSFPLPAFQIPGFVGSVGLNDRSHILLLSVVCRQPVVSVALAAEVTGAGSAPRGITWY